MHHHTATPGHATPACTSPTQLNTQEELVPQNQEKKASICLLQTIGSGVAEATVVAAAAAASAASFPGPGTDWAESHADDEPSELQYKQMVAFASANG